MRIAIITPGFLPVPDTKGGAVEMLTGFFVGCNENDKRCKIDLYTLFPDVDFTTLQETRIIPICVNKLEEYVSKILNFIYRKCSIEKHSNFYINRVVREMKKRGEKYDFILVENNVYAYKAIYKIYQGKTKFIFHLHNDIGGIDKPINICKLIARTAFKTIAVSSYIKHRFETCTGGNAYILSNCIDEKSYTVIDNEFQKNISKKYNINRDKKIYIYIGRIQKEKGCLELIKAFSKSEILRENAQLIVVGSIWYGKKGKSNYYEQIQRCIQGCNNIFLIGGVEHNKVASVLELADVCVIPSMCEEAFGMVALEAMIKKKALIVSNSGGLPEVVDESTPVLDRENIVENLRIIMEKYSLKSKQELVELGKKQYQRYQSIEEFNNRGYLDRLIQILQPDKSKKERNDENEKKCN